MRQAKGDGERDTTTRVYDKTKSKVRQRGDRYTVTTDIGIDKTDNITIK